MRDRGLRPWGHSPAASSDPSTADTTAKAVESRQISRGFQRNDAASPSSTFRSRSIGKPPEKQRAGRGGKVADVPDYEGESLAHFAAAGVLALVDAQIAIAQIHVQRLPL